ncbi:IclR family transcriptional regulator [Phreatobacter cathodiphilus]|uniref:IclR family transcriptional regulator n=1 Tax=Phreatobacter cathodiphilus TaxID=1868589 RepID=UPI001FE72CBF|nr:IclR family transcriptional regulator [Phreatobacter cathodiphilus]
MSTQQGFERRYQAPEREPIIEVDERLFLKSAARSFYVLEAFARSPRPLSLAEVAKGAKISKSAAQRVVQTLLVLGYLERSPTGTGVVPGRRILDRSFDYLRSNPLIERATPILTELRKTCGERVDLSLFDDVTILYAIRLQSKRETFYATLSGRRMPTFATAGGRAMLACLDDRHVDDIIRRSKLAPLTPKTLVDPALIRQRIEEARRDGYAYVQEEALMGEIVVAAAVVKERNMPAGAIHIAGSLADWSAEEFRKRFAPLAIEAARAMSG